MATKRRDAPTKATGRRVVTRLSEVETQAALNALVTDADENGVSPKKGVASSAVALLMKRGAAQTSSRASYLVVHLIQVGAIERLEHSHSVRVLRRTVSNGVISTPAPTSEPAPASTTMSATQGAYEETIRRLDTALTTSRARITELEAEVSQLRGQMPAQPSDDVRSIMEQMLRS